MLRGPGDADSLARAVEQQYPRRVEHRQVGIENEYPVVTATGEGVEFSAIRALFEDLADLGWQIERDPETSEPVSASQQREGAAMADLVTLEFGFHTLEVNLAPADDLWAAEAGLREVHSTLCDALRRTGSYLIGYGVQPLARPVADNVSPRGRYRVFERAWAGHPENEGDGLYLLTLSAASQTHVDVARDEAIEVVNGLNLTAGLRIALCANSPVWQGRIGGHAASRELFWDWAYPARAPQTGIPSPFRSVDDYTRRLLSFPCHLARRHEDFYALDHTRTNGDFLGGAANLAIAADGRTVELRPADEDAEMLWGLVWFDARLQPRYGTVEDRCSCEQPPESHLAPAALTLGLVENRSGLAEIAARLPLDGWRDLRTRACERALEIVDEEVAVLAAALLDAARTGLRARGCDEERYLDPLIERLAKRVGPASQAKAWFEEGGAAALVSGSDMQVFAHQSSA